MDRSRSNHKGARKTSCKIRQRHASRKWKRHDGESRRDLQETPANGNS
jgi:hypothetical protein